MTERIDEVDQFYKPIEALETFSSLLFWLCALISVVLPASLIWLQGEIQEWLEIAFVILVLAHSCLTYFSKSVLIPRAEKVRCKQLLSDSFDIPLTTYKTAGYYNNLVSPSVVKLGISILENSYFGKEICARMAIRERFKIGLYALVWLVAILNRNTDYGLILTLTQCLFSGNLLFRFLNVEMLRANLERVYDDLYNQFLRGVDSNNDKDIALILFSFAQYESAKVAASIKQSSNIFHELNPRLSSKWEGVRKQLDI